MFERNIHKFLIDWRLSNVRKPLILRGARQVGKTSSVDLFADEFDEYLYYNLEFPENKKPFLEFQNMDSLITSLYLLKNKSYNPDKKNLIFIDEIQEVPEAIALLRYFYEQKPDIFVVAAGSLLDMAFSKEKSFPVGRVEFKMVHPVSFEEFLIAIGENKAFEFLQTIPVPDFAHSRLMDLFHQYILIGGMPEVVAHYAKHKNPTALPNIYESLIQTYIDDVEKYAISGAQINQIRHAMLALFNEAGKRIKFENFGKSNYGSREMGEALRLIEKTNLARLIYPTTSTQMPVQPDYRKSPCLQLLDTGMMNYFTGMQKHIIGVNDLQSEYFGKIIEHVTGQEILSNQTNPLGKIHFWVREKKTSMAEVDFVLPVNGELYPLEVKSGAEGKLRSLHSFLDSSPINLGVRLNANQFQITDTKTIAGKKYRLLNLPYYCASKAENYIKKLG
jgi:predicted AAA+ superfamily ATPase